MCFFLYFSVDKGRLCVCLSISKILIGLLVANNLHDGPRHPSPLLHELNVNNKLYVTISYNIK